MVAGILLAASAADRSGKPNALIEVDGRFLVERGVRTLIAGGCSPIIVVLGAGAADVRARANLTGAVVVIDPDWRTGTGSTLRAGLKSLEPTLAQSVAVLSVDLPGITSDAVRRLAAHNGPDSLAAASYGGHLGDPVLLGRRHWPGVAGRAVGDLGTRPYLNAHASELTLVRCDDIADDTVLDMLPSSLTVARPPGG